jgi:hypothetical protein
MERVRYKLTALSDDHPSWNSRMEAWWQSGGALLWNRFGGISAEELVLDSDAAREFVRCASSIVGWNPVFSEECLETDCIPSDANAVRIERMSELQEMAPQPVCAAEEKQPTFCCRDCGRELHPCLEPFWQMDDVVVARRALNHLLNSLHEAIEYARGKGPNNWRVWQAALDETVRLLSGSREKE